MAGLGPEKETFSFSASHIHAAVAAVVISLLIHIGLAVFAAHVDIHLFSGKTAIRKSNSKYEPLRLESVEVAPKIREKLLDTLRAVGGETKTDIAKSLDELSVPPEEAATEPPPLDTGTIAGESKAMIENIPAPQIPDIAPPLQEILAIENRAVGDTIPELERKIIPKLERVPDAPDIVVPSSRNMLASTGPAAPANTSILKTPGVANITKSVIGGMEPEKLEEPPPPPPDENSEKEEPPKELFEETTEEVTKSEAIERVLKADIKAYVSPRDKEYGYFRLHVERAGKNLLPVLPKDIILVQDCSASMSEQRLFFCREGLRKSLDLIGPADRFNIAKFSDHTETCFSNWVRKTPKNIEKALTYINGMTAGGNTDLYASMSDLLALEKRPERPIIAFVITDGLVNKGITDNSEIIGEFSRHNNGRISVFTLGTSQLANRYLIDLLSYCNKGYVNVISKGRWDIPQSILKVMNDIRRPVLADMRLHIPSYSSCSIYPGQVSNLYLDRPLELYGRYRLSEKQLVFQVVGQAGSNPCDMLFTLPLPDSPTGSKHDDEIRKKWAQRKIYHLIGEYSRTGRKETLLEMRRTARKYHQPIPYKRRLF